MDAYYFPENVTINKRARQVSRASISLFLFVLCYQLPLSAQPFQVSIPGTAFRVEGRGKSVSVQGEQHVRAEAFTTLTLVAHVQMHPSSSADHKMQRLVVHFRTNKRGAAPTLQSVELREGTASRLKVNSGQEGDFTAKEIPKFNVWDFPDPIPISTQSTLRLEVRYSGGFEGLSDAGEFVLTDVKLSFPIKITRQSGTVADKSLPGGLGKNSLPPPPSTTELPNRRPQLPMGTPASSSPSTTGVFYAVSNTNELLWYNHLGKDDGSFKWATPAGSKVGTGWNFNQLFPGGGGIIYALTEDGDLLWYKHEGYNDGTMRWTFPEARKISSGWDKFDKIIAAGRGVFYLITANGDLLWYRHTGFREGSAQWATSQKIGSGWGDFRQVFSGGTGVLYAITSAGDLLWFRHDGYSDGANKWAAPAGKLVGTGWNFDHIFSGGDGIIYVIAPNGDLLWYKHTGYRDGTMRWAFSQAQKIGSGWGDFKQVLPH